MEQAVSVSQKDREAVLSLVLGSVDADVKENLTRTLETFSEGDREFMKGYLEGYADAFAVLQRAQQDMEP